MSDAHKNEVQHSALVLTYAGKAAGAEAEKDSAMGKLRNAYAQAKTAGVDVDALKAARKITSSKKKPGEIVAAVKTLGRTAQYAAMLNAEAFAQVDLVDYLTDMDTPTGNDQRIYQEGRIAALMGLIDVPPQTYAQSDQQHWCEGFKEGYAEYQTVMSMQADLDEQEPEEIDDEDLDDEDLDGEAEARPDEPEADPEPIDDPVMNNVAEFRRGVEAETDADDLPDIPEALDRKNWKDGKPPESTGTDAA